MKRALATVSFHYKIDLERGSEGYVLLEGDDLAEAQVWRLADAVEGPGSMLPLHFDEEVVPPVSLLNARSYFTATPSSNAEATSTWWVTSTLKMPILPTLMPELLKGWSYGPM